DELVRVTAAGLTDGSVDLDEVDVLWLGAPLRFNDTQVAGRDALLAYLDEGKGFAGRAGAGATLATDLGLFEIGVVQGPSRANGIVTVDTASDGILASTADAAALVYTPVYLTGLGDDVRVEQRYAAEPLISGHWLPAADGSGGPESAAGQAVS